MKYQNIMKNNKVQCKICPRNCILANGQKGYCYVRENTYRWAYDWVIPDNSSPYLNDGSREQRSLCLALIRQAMSGNPVNLNIFTDLKEGSSTFTTTLHGGFNYVDFLEDHWSGFVAYNIPDWWCLNLKPEVLEDILNEFLKWHKYTTLKEYLEDEFSCWFLFSDTERSDYYHKINKAIKTRYNSLTNKVQTNHETELQRKKASVIRGDLPEGSEQRSGKSKASVVCGHLCYNICSGGQED